MDPAALAPAFGVYVHIPFCARVCPYCDFAVVAGADDLAPAYVEALVAEAHLRAHREGPFPSAGSVFAGGGTPSRIPPALIARAIAGVRETFGIAPGAEVTLEANPEDCDAERLRALREAGANRLSIGAQSLAGGTLAALGRAHAPEQVRAAVGAARAAGFENLSLDLIFGAPGEGLDEWRATLEGAVGLGVEHLSCYSLTIEAATAFGREVAAGRMRGPDEDEQAAKYECAVEVLRGAGMGHYEISNWARAGFESAHNLVYWTQGDYVGLGAGAHSHVRGVRSWNRRNPRAYAADPAGAREGEERLDEAARAEEWLMLRLRLVAGIDLAEASRRLGRDLAPEGRALVSDGLATLEGGRLRLTTRGLLLENEVAGRLTRAGLAPRA